MSKKRIILQLLITSIIGVAAGGAVIWGIFRKIIKRDSEVLKRLSGYYYILNQWMKVKQEGKSVVSFFEHNHYKTVGIYGMKELGERLLKELEHTDITVKCIIDQNSAEIQSELPVFSPEDQLPEMDVIVVTASYYYHEIKEKLKGKVHGDIVSIDDVVYSKY